MTIASKEKASSGPALYLVTIAGSAGALAALNELLGGLPKSFGAALAIGLHTSLESRLAEVLRFDARLPIISATSGMPLRPGRAYVPPGGSHLIISPDVSLTVRHMPHVRQFRPSANWLFESAAAAYQHRHVAIVLGGMLRDGASRLALVKRAGGQVWVQQPAECAWPDMPRAALATGFADRVLPARQMSRALQRWLRTRDVHADRSAWESPFGAPAEV